MNEIAIRCDGLSKKYRIGERELRYKALRDTLTDVAAAPWRRMRSAFASGTPSTNGHASIWALKDVSFDVKRGEVVGIIGRNGAGKSTLLKILSRITKPTEGFAEIHGRVGSLLEVGTGFHPELTGRENIYLNGSIMGMPRATIDRKFDDIVSFAEVDQFIDTPVKRYSSGMHMRLAFAVAVHLEPEVLIIDEVLAVGDAQFQKKCLERISGIGKGGRTILLVSHNLYAVRSICQRVFVLEKGHLIAQGETNATVDKYVSQINQQDRLDQTVVETASFIVNDVTIQSLNSSLIKTFDPVEIRVRFTAKTDILDPGLYVGLLTNEHQRITGLDFKDFQTVAPIRAGQQSELGFSLDTLPILPGTYQIELHLKDMASFKIETVSQTFPFEVVETPIYGGRQLDSWFGYIGLNAKPINKSFELEEDRSL